MKSLTTLFFCLTAMAATAFLATEEPPQCNAREYQIELTNDSIYIYDGARKVKSIEWSDKNNYTEFEKVFLDDNL